MSLVYSIEYIYIFFIAEDVLGSEITFENIKKIHSFITLEEF